MPIEYYLNGYIVYVCILQDTFRLGQYPTGYYLNGYFAPWSISYRILPQRKKNYKGVNNFHWGFIYNYYSISYTYPISYTYHTSREVGVISVLYVNPVAPSDHYPWKMRQIRPIPSQISPRCRAMANRPAEVPVALIFVVLLIARLVLVVLLISRLVLVVLLVVLLVLVVLLIALLVVLLVLVVLLIALLVVPTAPTRRLKQKRQGIRL